MQPLKRMKVICIYMYRCRKMKLKTLFAKPSKLLNSITIIFVDRVFSRIYIHMTVNIYGGKFYPCFPLGGENED